MPKASVTYRCHKLTVLLKSSLNFQLKPLGASGAIVFGRLTLRQIFEYFRFSFKALLLARGHTLFGALTECRITNRKSTAHQITEDATQQDKALCGNTKLHHTVPLISCLRLFLKKQPPPPPPPLHPLCKLGFCCRQLSKHNLHRQFCFKILRKC